MWTDGGSDETMECGGWSAFQTPPIHEDQYAKAPVASSQEEDEAQVFASDSKPQKCNFELTRLLEGWASTNNLKVNISVVQASEDGDVDIKIKPASDLKLLKKLSGQTLTPSDGNEFKSLDLTRPEMKTEESDDHSIPFLPPSFASSVSNPQDIHKMLERCQLPVSHFIYVSHIYKEEMKHIEKKNGVEIAAETTVTFKPLSQKGGDPQKALSEFIKLVQKSSAESSGSTVPLKYVDPEQWKETLRIIQKKENKLFVTLSSEELIVCGPRQSQDIVTETLNTPERSMESHAMTSPLGHTRPPGATGFNSSVKNSDKQSEGAPEVLVVGGRRKSLEIIETMNTSEKTLTNVNEADSTWPSKDTPLKIDMNIKDPLTAGLTVEEDHWKLMTTSLTGKIDAITKKFDVDLQISDVSQGKVDIRPRYRKSGRHKSRERRGEESHAIRALLHPYQTIKPSPLGHTPFLGASGFSGSMKNNDKQLQGASSGPVSNGQSEEDEDDTCPLCMDTFTNKKRLKCKHAFCEGCLDQAEKVSGPICPVCRDVFDKIEGDQPEGTMSWMLTPTSLPGFPQCETIVIRYDIPPGIQTEKHPNPRSWFHGARRTAYLPDNSEGRDVLTLLQTAFEQKLIFTVGTSRTTGEEEVTWNDIHHKTSMDGGPESFGYPDPDYLSRVREELKAKGVE